MKKLGFGLMRLPQTDMQDGSSIDLEITKQMVDRFLLEGFTYFDTAYMYHNGMSEKVFGELVAKRYPRDAYTVTDKMPVFMIDKVEQYESIFAEQLERCQVEYFDYYFIHSLNRHSYKKVQEMDGFGFISRKKAEGKIKQIGLSFHDDAETLDRILTDHPETELVQLQINYIDWESEEIQSCKCYEVCMKHGIPVAIMEPLKGGALVNPPREAKDILKSGNPDASLASWGIRYAASMDNILIVLSGMSDMAQLEDNMSYMKDFQPLNDKEQELIQKTVDIINDSIAVACTGCRYCVDGCPKKIAIPEYFKLYNRFKQFGMLNSVRAEYKELTGANGKPGECIDCKQCENHCPQHLQIVESLKLVEAEL